MATVLPYSYGQLQVGLNLLRAKKAGLLDPVGSQHRFGLRNRGARHDGFIAVPSGDTDESGDFDPTQEIREHMRRLAKRKAALRSAEDEGYSSPSSSSSKRARSGSGNEQLIVKLNLSFPRGKWFLRGFCGEEEEEEEQSVPSSSAAPGFPGMVHAPPTPSGVAESSKEASAQASGKHAVPNGNDEPQELETGEEDPSEKEDFSKTENAVETSSPELPEDEHMAPLLSDPRIIAILGLPQPGISAPAATSQPSYVVASTSSAVDSPAQGQTPRTAVNRYITGGTETQQPRGGYYDIIPNIVSIQPTNRRRPWSVRN